MSRSTSPEFTTFRRRHVLLYDGVCGFCHGLVQFILRKDRKAQFAFAALQSPAGQEFLRRHSAPVGPDHLDTVYVILNPGIADERALSRSRAVAFVLRKLGGWWAPLGILLRAMPQPLADWGYDRFAGVRYRLFGRLDRCAIPSFEDRDRFLDAGAPTNPPN